MRTRTIVHQQICQLRWHLLACLGLVMVLPIEEAVVSLWEGDGFHSIRMAYAVITFSPLLAGLIACANVQGDLSEKRYIFWRSKPANVKKLMALKFFAGLILSLTIMACPLVFALASTALCGEDLGWQLFKHYVPVPIVVAMMAYSLCFGCNVLVRNTARSWLIGMFLAGFTLVIPLMLPLGFKDVVTDIGFRAWGFYPATILVTSAAAFVLALYAAEHDWHLRTNLRELLCVGAALVFVLLMLFSSQVANISVLDEKEIQISRWGRDPLNKIGNRLMFGGQNYVDVRNGGISLHKIEPNDVRPVNPPIYGNTGIDSEGRRVIYGPKVEGSSGWSYPRHPKALYMSTDDGTYCFAIIAYLRTEGEGRKTRTYFEEAYLRSYKLIGNSWKAVNQLDISDCITGRVGTIRRAMRLIDNTLVTCLNHSCVTVDVTEPADMKLIDKKIDVIRSAHASLRYMDPQSEFDIPLIPIEGISAEERIKLSIDLRYRFYLHANSIYENSMVDAHDGKIAFFYVSEEKVARFDVIRWDKDTVYCKAGNMRPFTILEGITGRSHHDYTTLVKDGKLYGYGANTLLVFDVRSNRGIRKLGHFVRMDWYIEDIAVLDDGNMLLSAQWRKTAGPGSFKVEKRYLYLLKNPK